MNPVLLFVATARHVAVNLPATWLHPSRSPVFLPTLPQPRLAPREVQQAKGRHAVCDLKP